MSDVYIKIRDNGPLVVEGQVSITDAEGGQFSVSADKPAIALCRCAASKNKPFCDGSHRDAGFDACDRAPAD